MVILLEVAAREVELSHTRRGHDVWQTHSVLHIRTRSSTKPLPGCRHQKFVCSEMTSFGHCSSKSERFNPAATICSFSLRDSVH